MRVFDNIRALRRRTTVALLTLTAAVALIGLSGLGCQTTPGGAALGSGEQKFVVPELDPPSAMYLPYFGDGSYRIADGIGAPTNRQRIIDMMPKVAAYGFGRIASMEYQGIARSPEDAAAYFAPLIEAARANNMKFVPGFYLHHIIDDVYGVPTDPPWSVAGPQADLNHPKNPSALTEQSFWTEFENRARIFAQGAQSNEVYVDSEFVFYQSRASAFWSDSTFRTIRPLAQRAIARLANDGITLLMYHPYVNPADAGIRKIAVGLFQPGSADDATRVLVHMAPAPYYRKANYVLPTPDDTMQTYADAGFDPARVRFGFISDHAQFPQFNLYGFSPQDFDTYCRDHPGTFARSWFVTGVLTADKHANIFAAMAPSVGPVP